MKNLRNFLSLIGFVLLAWAFLKVSNGTTSEIKADNKLVLHVSEEKSLEPKTQDINFKQRKAMIAMIHVLQNSHQIFSEAWRLLLGTQSDVPSSAMKVIANRLTQHLGQNHNWIERTAQCPKAHQELQIQSDPNFKQTKVNLSQDNCGKVSSVAQISWLSLSSNEDYKMSIEVHPNQILEGVGESLYLLNASIRCDFDITDSETIVNLSCHNLGQGLGRTAHFMFHQFDYHANQHDLLLVEGDKYENLLEKVSCHSKQPCYKLQVPLQGKIKIVENHKMGKSEKAAALNRAIEPAVTAPVNLPGLTVAGQSSSVDLENQHQKNTSAGDLNREAQSENRNETEKIEGPTEGKIKPPQIQAQSEQQQTEENQQEQQALQGIPTESAQQSEQQEENQSEFNRSSADRPSRSTVQPAGDAKSDLQSREPSGQESSAVFLPQR